MSAAFALGMLPFSSTRPACCVTPINVPTVSKRSVKRNVNTITTNLIERMPAKSNLKRRGEAGRLNGTHPSGTVVTPKGIPMIVVARIAMRIAPGTLRR